MPTRRFHRRALVSPGALLLVLAAAACWPFAVCVTGFAVHRIPASASESRSLANLTATMQPMVNNATMRRPETRQKPLRTDRVVPSSISESRLSHFNRVTTERNERKSDFSATPTDRLIHNKPTTEQTTIEDTPIADAPHEKSTFRPLNLDNGKLDSPKLQPHHQHRNHHNHHRTHHRNAITAKRPPHRSHDETTVPSRSAPPPSALPSPTTNVMLSSLPADAAVNCTQTASNPACRINAMRQSQHEETIADIANSSSITAAHFDHVDVIVVDATETETLEATTIAASTAMTVATASAGQHHRRRSTGSQQQQQQQQHMRSMNGTQQPRKRKTNLDRNERSTNVSLLSGTARKIQILMKNRLIQLLPDGTVNGTQDDRSDYTILQRGTVNIGQIRIQAVATCLFLCMDACGNIYSAKDFTDDCVFNETMQENYNIYSSSMHSTAQRTYYLALNKMGQPRRTHLPAGKDLGKLATYAKSLTFTVSEAVSTTLIGRLFGPNHVRHGLKQLCDSGRSLVELTHAPMLPRPHCAATAAATLPSTTTGTSSSTSLAASTSPASPARPRNGHPRLHGKAAGPMRSRAPGTGATAKCTHDNCQPPARRRKHPHAKGAGTNATAANASAAGGALATAAAREHRAKNASGSSTGAKNIKKPNQTNVKKGHRRKRPKDQPIDRSERSTAASVLRLLQQSTTSTVAGDDDIDVTENVATAMSTSTDPSDEDQTDDADDQSVDQSSAPSTGHTSFVEPPDEASDDFDA